MGVSLLGGLWYLVVGWLFRFGIGVCRLFLLASGWGVVLRCLRVGLFGCLAWCSGLDLVFALVGFVGLRSICWFGDWCFWVVLVDCALLGLVFIWFWWVFGRGFVCAFGCLLL